MDTLVNTFARDILDQNVLFHADAMNLLFANGSVAVCVGCSLFKIVDFQNFISLDYGFLTGSLMHVPNPASVCMKHFPFSKIVRICTIVVDIVSSFSIFFSHYYSHDTLHYIICFIAPIWPLISTKNNETLHLSYCSKVEAV